jgi:hypothetical protein
MTLKPASGTMDGAGSTFKRTTRLTRFSVVLWQALQYGGTHRKVDFLFFDMGNPYNRQQLSIREQPTMDHKMRGAILFGIDD